MLRLACLLTIALSPVSASAGACAQPQPRFAVVTAADAAISSAGGLVAEIDDLAKAPAWRFDGASKDVAFTPVAPGLTTIDLPKGSGWLTLDGPDHKPLVRVKHADKDAAALAAPDVKAVHYTSTTGRRGTYVSVDVDVRAIPKDAVALVIYGIDKSGHVARSWGPAADRDPSDKTINVYRSGSCVAQPVGTLATNTGDRVELAWLDSSGRLSKPSAALAVTSP